MSRRIAKKKAEEHISKWKRYQYSEIINGHPLSCGMAPLLEKEKVKHIDNALFSDLPKDYQKYVMEWISGLKETKVSVLSTSSYGLKHVVEQNSYDEIGTRIYMTNNQFKDAMLLAGFEPTNPNALNWTYHISKRSPSLHRERYRV